MSFTPKLSSNGLKWLFIFFIFGSFPLAGQKAQIEFFQTNEHLSSFDPQKIMQDKDGFLWVMGQSVDRYDGYNFVNIKEQEKGWEDFELDKQHYISSEDEIIYRSEDHFISRQVKTGKADSIYFRDLLLDGEIINEDFFFHETTSDQRYFFFYEPSTKKTTFLEWKEGRLNRKFFRTDIGTVGDLDFPSLISDTHGNFFYRNKTKTHFIKIDSEGNLLQKIPSPVSSSYIRFLKRGVNNTIYAVYPNEIFQLKEHADSFELHPINQYLSSKSSFKFIMDFLELPNEDLWVCGDDRKLFLYKQATGKVYDYRKELSQLIPIRASLLELISDQTGILWIRIQQFGILKVIPQQSLFDTYVTEPECDGFCSFRGMVENESGQIFASFYDGVFQLDPTNKTSTKLFPHIVNYFPFGLGYNDGHLLLNSGQRLNSYTGEMDENIPMIPGYRTDEGAMAEDDSGNWWNGQGQNVWFFDTKSKNKKWKKKIQVPGENAKITCLHFGEKSKRIWIANRHQLFYIDVHNNIITKYVEMHGKEIIHAIYEDKRKNIWLGTENGFVVVEPHNKILKKYKTQDGLPHDFVSGILSEGDSCLWLGTNSGLSRFQIEKEIFTNFYTEHG